MEPEGSLPHSQASATCPYPGPAQSSSHTHIPPPGSIPTSSTHLHLGLPSGLFPSGFPTKTLYAPSPHPYAPHAQPVSFFSILSPVQYWMSSTDHLAPRYAISSIPPLPRPFSNSLSFLSSLNVSAQVSHPYKTTGKIIVLYILIFKFLDSNLEDERFCRQGSY